jgi:uncharacterized phage protein (TIGR02218 family)
VRQIPAALLADLQADCTTLAFCWTITMANGDVIRGTEHDLDITIPSTGSSPVDPYAGTYRAIANVTASDIASTSDLSVDNLNVSGAFQNRADESPLLYNVLDISVNAVESGLLDQAPVGVIICNWAAPEHGYFEIKGGYLGEITRTSDGSYTTEVRGLTQALQQIVIRCFSPTCNVVQFGDARCKYPVEPLIRDGTVTAINSQTEFSVALTYDGDSPERLVSFVGGELTFVSGLNTGYAREAKTDPNSNEGVVQFWEGFPELINRGDAFKFKPGCDRTFPTCQFYRNHVNFRGFGLFIPGVNAILAGPTTTEELGS